jgi:HEAT repeat protein
VIRFFAFLFFVSSLSAGEEQLVLQLSSGTESERANAAYLLGMSNDPGAAELLIAQLKDEPSHSNQLIMIESLRRLDDPEGYAALKEYYLNVNDPSFRRIIIQALGESGNPAYVPLIGQFLQKSDESGSRLAMTALSRIKHPDSLKVLIQFLVDKRAKPQFRELALTALAAQGMSQASPPLIRLGNATKDPVLRAGIGEVLGKLGDKNAREALSVWMRDTREKGLKIRYIRGLRQLGDPLSLESLAKEWSHGDAVVQNELVEAMLAIDEQGAIPYLEECYERSLSGLDPDMNRMEAIALLRLHRQLRAVLHKEGGKAEMYPSKWKEDPILVHLILES